MALRTSLIIAGDSSSAVQAADQTGKALDATSAQAAKLGKAYAAADVAITRLAAAQVSAKRETEQAKAAYVAGEIELKDYNARLLETKSALSLVEAEHRKAVGELKKLGAASTATGQEAVRGSRQAQAGYVNFGRQVQDVAVMLQSGANIGTIVALQGGQVADAVSQMQGRFAGLGRFMAGPMGTAIIVLTSSLLNMVQAQWQASRAADDNEEKQLSLADALDKARYATDQAREALRDYNAEQERARENTDAMIKLKLADADADIKQAIAIREKIKAQLDYLQASEKYNSAQGLGQVGGADIAQASQFLAERSVRNRIAEQESLIGDLEETRRNLRIQDAERDAKAAADPIVAINNKYDDMAAAASRAAAGNEALSLSLKATLSEIEKRRRADLEAERASRRSTRSTVEQVAERAEDAAKKIANIKDQFSDLPSAVEKANKAMRELQDLSSDIERSKIPAAQKSQLKDAIEEAGKAIEASLSRDAAEKIANIKDQFSDLPIEVEKASKAMRKLQDLSSDIERSKIPAAQKSQLKDAIEEAGRAVEASLNRPFDDYLEKSREGVRLADLLAAGRDEEAEALKIVLSLKDKMRPLDQAQLAIILATVRAEEQRSLALRDQRALIQANVAEVHNMREALERTVADAFRGRFSIERVLAQLGNSYINLTAQRFVEKMFGDTLRSIEEQARRGGPVDEAATAIATAMGKGEKAVTSLAEAMQQATARINGTQAPAANDNAGAANDNGDGETYSAIGTRPAKLAGATPAELIGSLLSGLGGDLKLPLAREVGSAVEKGLSKLDKTLPSLLAGAFTGASTSRIILGDRGTGGTIGSAVGGALGQKAGEQFLKEGLSSISSRLGSFAGPLGSIAGGLIGGLVGGLFKKTPSASSGAITSVDQAVSARGSGQAVGAVNATAKGVQEALNQIISAVGGTPGPFSVSIGTRGSYYRVSASGQQDASAKYFSRNNSDSLYDGQDEQTALRLAVQNAIQDGAVQGISNAMRQALGSTPDIDAAVREALKVQDLEVALGGVSGALEKSFKDYEAQAKDRLRIARTYGLDIVKTEELNAKQRLALSEQLLSQQVGSLQSLLDEITGGALFEGSAVDKRAAIFAQIDKVKADADAGVEGAADRLAQLIEQGLAASKEVNATTGGYAADRQLLVDAARDTITRANQRVNEAQKTSDPALAQTNSLLDEGNDQSARIINQLASIDNWLQQLNAGGGAANSYDGLRNVVAFK